MIAWTLAPVTRAARGRLPDNQAARAPGAAHPALRGPRPSGSEPMPHAGATLTPVRLLEGDEVGVGKLRREEESVLEAPAPQVVASRRQQHFDGHAPAELHVGGEVDGRHAALAQLTYEGVAAREGTSQAVEQGVGGHG